MLLLPLPIARLRRDATRSLHSIHGELASYKLMHVLAQNYLRQKPLRVIVSAARRPKASRTKWQSGKKLLRHTAILCASIQKAAHTQALSIEIHGACSAAMRERRASSGPAHQLGYLCANPHTHTHTQCLCSAPNALCARSP